MASNTGFGSLVYGYGLRKEYTRLNNKPRGASQELHHFKTEKMNGDGPGRCLSRLRNMCVVYISKSLFSLI